MKDLVVALDLEMNQPSERIVQIGAVLGNVRTGEVVSQFDAKVNPGEPFSSRIAELTGISALELEGAPSLAVAGNGLAAWVHPIVALPLAALAVARYLSAYTEHTPIAFWSLAVALVAALATAAFAAARQAWIAMMLKPAVALHT